MKRSASVCHADARGHALDDDTHTDDVVSIPMARDEETRAGHADMGSTSMQLHTFFSYASNVTLGCVILGVGSRIYRGRT